MLKIIILKISYDGKYLHFTTEPEQRVLYAIGDMRYMCANIFMVILWDFCYRRKLKKNQRKKKNREGIKGKRMKERRGNNKRNKNENYGERKKEMGLSWNG